MKIISGGQTGVDRAALDECLIRGIECGGWCPAGRLAEDGIIPERYPLQETPSSDFKERTLWNVRDSDASLIFSWGTPSGGTQYAIECCQSLKKPYLLIDMKDVVDLDKAAQWIKARGMKVLNVAGPRESFFPGFVYKMAREHVGRLFDLLG